MLRALALSLLALGAQAAHAQSQIYTVDIRPVLNDLDIKIEHVAQSRMLILNLTNNSPTRVRCNLRYDASPQTPLRATRHINPGRTGDERAARAAALVLGHGGRRVRPGAEMTHAGAH